LVGAEAGATVHARLRRRPDGTVQWLSVSVADPLPGDDEVLAGIASGTGDTMPDPRSIDAAPEGTWPDRID
jgi:hypothetical protein